MASFNLNAINSALDDSNQATTGVDFSGKSLKLDTAEDAKPIIDAINACPNLQYLTLTGNTLGVAAAEAIAKALEHHPELKYARWSDMFTGRMKTEIPPALKALGDGMIAAGARLAVLDLSDNAFGPIGVEGLAKLLQSEVCSQLEELRLNNNGLGITGAKILANALSVRPPRLKVFIAGRNRLENDGAKALANVFQKMGTLEELAMPQNGIYHPGITALSEALSHNPMLGSINLNDNTVGAKGAAALASALPRLKRLKSINFGDCLLKSKGALALAKAFKDNEILLESLDLSHNEIGRVACMAVVEAVAGPRARLALARLVLAGNSLGGAANKKIMKEKLGDSAQLSDGEGSDDEYVTDSESEEEGGSDEDSQNSGEDSATEDAQHLDSTIASIVEQVTLDDSGLEEVESDVTRFLKDPSEESLKRLGPNAVDLVDAHLRGGSRSPSEWIAQYVECALRVRSLLPGLLAAANSRAATSWLLANAMLTQLALIKSENKRQWPESRLAESYKLLASVIDSATFPAALRDTLKFFIKSKKDALPEQVQRILQLNPNLYT